MAKEGGGGTRKTNRILFSIEGDDVPCNSLIPHRHVRLIRLKRK